MGLYCRFVVWLALAICRLACIGDSGSARGGSYEKFVAELASKPAGGARLGRARSADQMSASDGAAELLLADEDEDESESDFGSLLPPAPGATRTGLHRRGAGAAGDKKID